MSNNLNILKTISYFGGALVFVLSAVFLSNLIDEKTKDNNPKGLFISTSSVQCPSDTTSYKEVRGKKNIVLLENKNSFAQKGSFEGQTYTVKIKRTGLKSQIACGYLFYKLSVGDKPILQKYEGLYMVPTNSKQFGGHIIPDEKNALSIDEKDNKTEILMPLNVITYDGTARKDIKQSDWVSLLNVANEISFDIALNTINKQGNINSVEIAYKCWNPQTGQETDDCNLEIVK